MRITIDDLRNAFPLQTGFAVLPTQVDRFELPDGNEIWVKRDDTTGRLYAGNKVRKLEYLLGDARHRGATEICTVGAIGSNHVLATAIHANHLGFGFSALHFPQPVTDHVRHNLLALSSLDPDLTLVTDASLPTDDLKAALRVWKSQRPSAYFIPAGGSSAVGALGYVQAGLELAKQWEGPRPECIVVAAGTCGTLAGLRVGLELAGWDTPIHGIRVVERSISNPFTAARLANQVWALIQGALEVPQRKFSEADFPLDQSFYGSGYGVPTEDGLRAIEVADALGMHLEPTYTGKTFAGVLQHAQTTKTLYWHTLSGVNLKERVELGAPGRLPPAYQAYFQEPA